MKAQKPIPGRVWSMAREKSLPFFLLSLFSRPFFRWWNRNCCTHCNLHGITFCFLIPGGRRGCHPRLRRQRLPRLAPGGYCKERNKPSWMSSLYWKTFFLNITRGCTHSRNGQKHDQRWYFNHDSQLTWLKYVISQKKFRNFF